MIKTRILCAGIFDNLIAGHLKYLRECRNLSFNSELLVIIARDSTVERLKGKKPNHNEDFRLMRVKALDFVDDAVLGFENEQILDRIISLQPDIIALGHDHYFNEEGLKNVLKNLGFNIQVIRMPKYEV